jgi:hypothetical protein
MSETMRLVFRVYCSIPFFGGGFVSTDYASTDLLFSDRQLCIKGLERKNEYRIFNQIFLGTKLRNYIS